MREITHIEEISKELRWILDSIIDKEIWRKTKSILFCILLNVDVQYISLLTNIIISVTKSSSWFLFQLITLPNYFFYRHGRKICSTQIFLLILRRAVSKYFRVLVRFLWHLIFTALGRRHNDTVYLLIWFVNNVKNAGEHSTTEPPDNLQLTNIFLFLKIDSSEI